jgi:hypothetical protein
MKYGYVSTDDIKVYVALNFTEITNLIKLLEGAPSDDESAGWRWRKMSEELRSIHKQAGISLGLEGAYIKDHKLSQEKVDA